MDCESPARTRKKRVPTACAACRHAKAKCDGKTPCSRCHALRKPCKFAERPKDPYQEKVDSLQREVSSLKSRLSLTPSSTLVSIPSLLSNEGPYHIATGTSLPNPFQAGNDLATSSSSYAQTTFNSSPTMSGPGTTTQRRKSHFDKVPAQLPDFITAGLLSHEQAATYFSLFFQGCDHYVPVFDPRADKLQSIRDRSSLLLGAICTVGCRVVCGTESHQWRLLNFHLRRMISCAISNPDNVALETVQALLVRACYSSERSLLVAAATRMAVDLGLPNAYDELCGHLATTRGQRGESETVKDVETLLARARTWLHLLVLGHILHVDAGDALAYKFVGDARRSRILLRIPCATTLDHFLLAQVELNVLRENIHTSLSGLTNETDDNVMAAVRDTMIDIDLWFGDWERMFQSITPAPSWLLVNLRVQKCWSETMALCRAVRAAGVENVDLMSGTQKAILLMARDSLQQHLSIILSEPRYYLQNLRFAMDFVWAKCTFCFLLLLKLAVLLPEPGRQLNSELVTSGDLLLRELSEVNSGCSGSRSNTGKLYVQLLQTGIEKFQRVVHGEYGTPERVPTGDQLRETSTRQFTAGQSDLESYVPEQFVFEWDFPGLTLFSSSSSGIGWLDDILLGALNGGGDLFGLMSTTTDFME